MRRPIFPSEADELVIGPGFHLVPESHVDRRGNHQSVIPRDTQPQASPRRGPRRNAHDGPTDGPEPVSRLIVAIDFGTTYSTVSYAKIEPGTDPTRLSMNKIRCVNGYNDAGGGSDSLGNNRVENVPTKLLYLGPGTEDDLESEDEYFEVDATSRKRKNGSNQGGSEVKKRCTTTLVRWGYTVQAKEQRPQALARFRDKESLALMKLALGEATNEDDVDLQRKREELQEQVGRLLNKAFIQHHDQPLRDYLERLLLHAKTMFEAYGLLEAAKLEYVLCVPVSWSPNACRTMHDALAKAINACKLDVLPHDLIPDLFIVAEPEAAAQYVVASFGADGHLKQGEVFVLLDAGGGTVDITTYKVTSDERGPLRLQGEVVPPDAALCGSSLITERYLRAIRSKLRQIDPNGDPALLDAEATALAHEWDIKFKGAVDLSRQRGKSLTRKGGEFFHGHHLIEWTEDEIRGLFEPSLRGTTNLLESQLQLAREKGLVVSKVIVVGGFGESPSLKSRIRQLLVSSPNAIGLEIEARWAMFDDIPTSAVARGAILRALDKRNGPSRISRSSFGFLRHEQMGFHPEHEEAGAEAEQDGIDGGFFISNTIEWVIKAGEALTSPYQTKPIMSEHTFKPRDRKLVCIECLYASPRAAVRSHFQRDYLPVNEGATEIGRIEIDVSKFLNKFEVVRVQDTGPPGKKNGRYLRRRLVQFDLVISIEEKLLKYEARWPANAQTPDHVLKRWSGLVSLASDLAPGAA